MGSDFMYMADGSSSGEEEIPSLMSGHCMRVHSKKHLGHTRSRSVSREILLHHSKKEKKKKMKNEVGHGKQGKNQHVRYSDSRSTRELRCPINVPLHHPPNQTITPSIHVPPNEIDTES